MQMESNRSTGVTRRFILSSLTLASTVGLCQQPIARTSTRKYLDFDEPLAFEHPHPAFSVLFGPGGNIGIRRGAQGLTVIDTGIAERTDQIVSAIAGLKAGPVLQAINTHWHLDHVGGNEAFAKAGTTLFAHENVRISLSHNSKRFGRPVPAAAAAAWPSVTFKDAIELHSSAGPAMALHLPNAHTDGDTAVFLPDLNILQTGDLYWSGGYPLIDFSSGGCLDGMIEASAKLIALANDKTLIVPGHGPLSSRAELQEFLAMLRRARELITPLVKAGLPFDRVRDAKPFTELDPKWAQRFETGDGFLRGCYFGCGR